MAAPELSLALQDLVLPGRRLRRLPRLLRAQAGADALAAELHGEGLDVSVYGVPAYSTLGWLQLAAGRRPAAQHLHRLPRGRAGAPDLPRARAPGGVTLPATRSSTSPSRRAVETHRRPSAGSPPRQRRGAQRLRPRRAPGAPISARSPARCRDQFHALYASAASDADKRAAQGRAAGAPARRLRRHEARRAGAATPATTAGSRAPTTPPSAILVGYTGLVPAFERLFEREGRDFDRFYAEVRRVAALAPAERRAALER